MKLNFRSVSGIVRLSNIAMRSLNSYESSFQWKRNPYYRNSALFVPWFSFSEPLEDLVPDFFLVYVNQFALITGANFLYNGKIIDKNI